MRSDPLIKDLIKDLQTATADLHQINPFVGGLRFAVLGVLVISLVALAWSTANLVLSLAITAIAGLFYAFWLICTHDMIHATLTGWGWFDRVLSRLISYPMLWPCGLYAELHRLHHGWNGVDLRDPERVQWTKPEYQQANPLLRWYVRHQWQVDILGLAGVGLIAKTVLHAWQLQPVAPRIRRQFLLDGLGILLVQGTLLTVALIEGELGRYLLFWLILERMIGLVAQTRDHLEHYALWGKASGHQLTQLYASRNLNTHPIVGWLMGGLDYHAVHHAFPDIPFYQLPIAFERIQLVLAQHQLPPMQQGNGYLKEALYFSQHSSLIDETRPADATGRNQMLPIAGVAAE